MSLTANGMFVQEDTRPTSTSVVLVGDVCVCQVRMLCSKGACTQGERAGLRPKQLKVEDGLKSRLGT